MKAIPMTREWARAVGYDAAEASRKKAGRSEWRRDDYNRAVREFNRLWPVKRDKGQCPTYEERYFATTMLRRQF